MGRKAWMGADVSLFLKSDEDQRGFVRKLLNANSLPSLVLRQYFLTPILPNGSSS